MKGGEGGKEECFGYGVPPPFPGTWRGEIIKVLSENEDMVPAPGVAGDPPPESGTFKGGAGSPGVQIKGYRALRSQQQWGKEVQAPSTLLLSGEKGRGKSHSIPGKGKLCHSPEVGDRHSFENMLGERMVT